MAKDYDKQALVTDWKTGDFTQRDLASRYKISPGMVARLTKGVEQNIKVLVSKQIEINQSLKNLSEQEVSKFKSQVLTKELELTYLDNAVMMNVQAVVANIEQGLCNPADLKANADTLDKAYISLRHAKRHSNQSVNVQTNVQSNTMSELIRETTGKVLRPA